MSVEGVRKIFNLDENEMIFDSFECNFKAHTGRCYITDKTIGFYGNVGIKSKR